MVEDIDIDGLLSFVEEGQLVKLFFGDSDLRNRVLWVIDVDRDSMRIEFENKDWPVGLVVVLP